MMELVHGFLKAPEMKQIGGKDNKEPIAEHVINVIIGNIPDPYCNQLSKMFVVAELIGYKKPMLVKDKIVLGTLQKLPLLNPTESSPRPTVDIITLRFSDLVVKHSSHNHGQKLLIRFNLVAPDEKILYTVESAEFETITRRGIEKQRQKEVILKKKIEEETNSLPPPFVTRVEPNVSVVEGGNLIKIYIQNLPPSISLLNYRIASPISDESSNSNIGGTPHKHKSKVFRDNIISVFIGQQECREVFCGRDGVLICEIPPSLNAAVGKVSINVSIDGKKTCLPSQAALTYVTQDELFEFFQNQYKHGHLHMKRIQPEHISAALSLYQKYMNNEGNHYNTVPIQNSANASI